MELKENTTIEQKSNVGEALANLFDGLPKTLQDFILDGNFERKVSNIARSHNLQGENETFLENEVLKALLTVTDENELSKNLSDGLGVGEGRVGMILKDVEEKIFAPIAERLDALEAEERKEVVTKESGVLPQSFDEKVELVGRKNNLRVDEMGTLKEWLQKVSSGEITSKELGERFRAQTSWDEERINSLVKDINSEIFKEARATLGKPTDEESLDRDDILREIEGNDPAKDSAKNPLPQDWPKPAPDQGPPKEFLKGNVEMEDEILEGKLKNQTITKREEVNRGPKYKGGDPYREPIE